MLVPEDRAFLFRKDLVNVVGFEFLKFVFLVLFSKPDRNPCDRVMDRRVVANMGRGGCHEQGCHETSDGDPVDWRLHSNATTETLISR